MLQRMLWEIEVIFGFIWIFLAGVSLNFDRQLKLYLIIVNHNFYVGFKGWITVQILCRLLCSSLSNLLALLL